MAIISCNRSVKSNFCNDSIDTVFSGRVVSFYHKPISGSIYQVYLFPTCDNCNVTDASGSWGHLGTGLLFTLSSDDPNFQIIRKAGFRKLLKVQMPSADYLKSIYITNLFVSLSYQKKDTLPGFWGLRLVTDTDSAYLLSRGIAAVSLKIDSVVHLPPQFE